MVMLLPGRMPSGLRIVVPGNRHSGLEWTSLIVLSINNIIGSVQKTFDTPDYIIFKVYKVYKVPPAGRFVCGS